VAPATPQGRGAISMVRLTGPEAFPIAEAIFRPSGKVVPRRAVYGKFYDFIQGTFFDEGIAIFYRPPHSYTGEDMVEFTPHGNPIIVWKIVELATAKGARLARPGEFTYRAFLNGKMDLVRAEAVEELVEAQSFEGVKLSFSQLQGGLSKRVEELREGLLSSAVLLETEIEFPDEGIEVNKDELRKTLEGSLSSVRELLSLFETGKQLLEGVTLVLVGKPNSGKSSLFNAILEEERAIVTEVPGTTRDFLRERIIIDGVAFILIDTAGMNPEPGDEIEREGMRRAELLLREADGAILILDGARPLEPADHTLINLLNARNKVVVINKIDLPLELDPEEVKSLTGEAPLLISAKKRQGLDSLKDALKKKFILKQPALSLYINSRQRIALKKAEEHLLRALESEAPEIVAQELREAILALEEILGKITPREVLNNIFSRFCIGK